MGDNGEVKTSEVLAQERLGRYHSNPNSFIELSELICAAMRSDKGSGGIAVYVGNARRSELNQSWAELNCRLSLILQQMTMEQGQCKIIPPKKGILDFARRR